MLAMTESFEINISTKPMPSWLHITTNENFKSKGLNSAGRLFVCAAMLLVSGCASSSSPSVDSLEGPPQATQATNTTEYTLSKKERALDCKVIRGRMKVAIFQLQSQNRTPTSTGLSRSMQNTAAGIFGGTTYGTDPSAYAARETARLKAYNKLLKDQGCKSYDLQKELAQPTPS